MVIFFVVTGIGFIISYIIACRWKKSGYITDKIWTILFGTLIGAGLGTGLSFLGGSFFVKKEIVAEKYFISPMIFGGKPIAALVENSSSYILQIKEIDGNKTKLIKRLLSKEEIFFTDEGEERYLEIKRSRTCGRNMWVWFFYSRFIESKAVLKKGDNFLTLPRYYSL